MTDHFGKCRGIAKGDVCAFLPGDREALLETGVFATVEELAAAEKINLSYVSRVLRLTLLAPDIVEAILDGTLAVLMRPFAVGWERQRAIGFCRGRSTID